MSALAAALTLLVAPARADDGVALPLLADSAALAPDSVGPALPPDEIQSLPDVEVPSQDTAPEPYRLAHFTRDTKAAKWPLLGMGAAITATRIGTLVNHPSGFRFSNEGWFGKGTESLGMDKMHHGYKTYVMADLLTGIIANKTGDRKAAAYSGALLGLGLMTYGELFDGFSSGHGWSNQDMAVHMAGAGVAVLRNTVPGMREKLDFRMEIRPSLRGEALQLTNQLDDRKYLFAVQLAGFKGIKKGPLRFAEVHLGYYARGFTDKERLRGEPLRRKIYVGIGLNLQKLLFRERPSSRAGRMARGVLDYLQIPYSAVEFP